MLDTVNTLTPNKCARNFASARRTNVQKNERERETAREKKRSRKCQIQWLRLFLSLLFQNLALFASVFINNSNNCVCTFNCRRDNNKMKHTHTQKDTRSRLDFFLLRSLQILVLVLQNWVCEYCECVRAIVKAIERVKQKTIFIH